MISTPRSRGRLAYPVPLAEEEELAEHVSFHFQAQAGGGRREGRRFGHPQLVGPFPPRPAALIVLDRHEEGVVLQPGTVLLPEGGVGFEQAVGGGGAEGVECGVEDGQFPGDHGPVVDAVGGERRDDPGRRSDRPRSGGQG